MKYKFSNTLVLIVIMAYLGTVNAATTKFNYQGKVLLSSQPVSGTVAFIFSLKNGLTGGLTLAVNNRSIIVENGIVNTELDFSDVHFNGQSLWLEIEIEDPSSMAIITLSPRIPINTAPYAIQSDFVADNGVTGASVVNGSLLGVDFADFTISENKIGNFQISNNKIVNQTIGFEKFATNGASNGNIIQYNSTSGEWEAVSQSGVTTPWVDVGTGIFYQGNVGIGTGSSFSPNAPLDIRSILNNTIFKVNLDGSIKRTLQTRILTLGYQAFTPEKSSFKYEINSSGTIAGISNVETSSNNVKLYAPILLPHGATITKFELLAFDDDPSEQVSASLKRTSFSTNNVSSTLSTLSTGVVPTPGGIVVSSGLLNLNYFSSSVFYAFITIDKPGIPGTDLIFSGVKITYEIDTL